MATKKTTTTTSTKTKLVTKNFVNFMAYVAIVFIGISLILTRVFTPNSFTNALELVANVISYLLVAFFSLNYARGKKNWVFILIWAIALALIIVFVVLAGLKI